MPEHTGPVPVPTPETRPYWEAARRHALELPRCRTCGDCFFYPRAACPRCLSGDLEWVRASGRGTLHTFTVVHRGLRDFPLGTPYVIAIVELAEGPRLMTNLVGVEPDPACLRIGMPVEVVFEDVSAEVALPRFRPAPA
ncbi:MAG: Zn-ribbon domain-containing OB-fold protein [Deltaproteobacteria bacterium]|nr:MAG: Zn-ribbon domain-containing OB-fold protein [Deltaproteobacteria bacterium]